MKIIFFITGLGMGGAEKVVCELADRLYEKGHNVSLVYFTGEILRKPKNPIYIYKFNLSAFNVLSLYKILKFIKEENPDIIHSHMFHANMMARFVKFFNKNIKVICSSHSNFEGGKLRMYLYSLTENLCNAHTSVSKNAAHALEKAGAVNKKNIIPIFNGINTNQYHYTVGVKEKISQEFNIEANKKIIVTIGRIDTPKDYPNLLYAIKKILSIRGDIHLLIIGDGPKRKNIEQLAEVLNLSNYVTFVGIRTDIPQILSAADLFVSSSAWEGFGLAILEAMLCKRPIVATKTDGAIELLDEKYLVPCNDPVMLAKGIINTLNENHDLVNYSNADLFSWDNILKEWELIYEN